jgi:hypothetical protein
MRRRSWPGLYGVSVHFVRGGSFPVYDGRGGRRVVRHPADGDKPAWVEVRIDEGTSINHQRPSSGSRRPGDYSRLTATLVSWPCDCHMIASSSTSIRETLPPTPKFPNVTWPLLALAILMSRLSLPVAAPLSSK